MSRKRIRSGFGTSEAQRVQTTPDALQHGFRDGGVTRYDGMGNVYIDDDCSYEVVTGIYATPTGLATQKASYNNSLKITSYNASIGAKFNDGTLLESLSKNVNGKDWCYYKNEIIALGKKRVIYNGNSYELGDYSSEDTVIFDSTIIGSKIYSAFVNNGRFRISAHSINGCENGNSIRVYELDLVVDIDESDLRLGFSVYAFSIVKMLGYSHGSKAQIVEFKFSDNWDLLYSVYYDYRAPDMPTVAVSGLGDPETVSEEIFTYYGGSHLVSGEEELLSSQNEAADAALNDLIDNGALDQGDTIDYIDAEYVAKNADWLGDGNIVPVSWYASMHFITSRRQPTKAIRKDMAKMTSYDTSIQTNQNSSDFPSGSISRGGDIPLDVHQGGYVMEIQVSPEISTPPNWVTGDIKWTEYQYSRGGDSLVIGSSFNGETIPHKGQYDNLFSISLYDGVGSTSGYYEGASNTEPVFKVYSNNKLMATHVGHGYGAISVNGITNTYIYTDNGIFINNNHHVNEVTPNAPDGVAISYFNAANTPLDMDGRGMVKLSYGGSIYDGYIIVDADGYILSSSPMVITGQSNPAIFPLTIKK